MADTEALEQLFSTPARTDDDVVALVTGIVGRPVRRQCWVVFLDDRARPVPFLLPVSDLPWQPDEHVEDFAALVADVRDDVSAAEVVLVWERPGDSRLFPVDWEWVDACACAFRERGIRLRGQVVVHTAGVAMIELEEHELPEPA
ncbi:hypothetical protein [Curtobacterium citreum]|uniref:hypothetical protein n=1 Tax=Curtobacterium citreum TaxID=2036 RepID=UPI0007376CA7|nr:hypothetical protein [Curtobacterium citreum]KTR19559.1 hypothetical protein NS330_07795 [Curtobacterium citreum]